MGTVGAIAEVIALSLGMLKDHIDDPKRRAKAIADYINGLRAMKEKMSEAEMEELDSILLSIVSAKP